MTKEQVLNLLAQPSSLEELGLYLIEIYLLKISFIIKIISCPNKMAGYDAEKLNIMH